MADEHAEFSDWQPDILGPDYKARSIFLGEDPDRETDIYATLVRYQPGRALGFDSRPAMVFVHGMSDYFFHTHVASFFHEHGWAVYAVDLRKCGRSWRPGQRWHHTTDLGHYFSELSAAAAHLASIHQHVLVQGHSTGGLVVALWLDHIRRTDPELHATVLAAVLNSPWLDMMVPGASLLRPLAMRAAARWPDRDIPGGNFTAYGQSLKQWNFDRRMKPLGGHPKNLGWLRAIIRGHEQVHSGELECGVPVLVLCSTQSYSGHRYPPKADVSDVILDVEQIQHWAPKLGKQVQVTPIAGARHDVYLSEHAARHAALDRVLKWLPNPIVKEL